MAKIRRKGVGIMSKSEKVPRKPPSLKDGLKEIIDRGQTAWSLKE